MRKIVIALPKGKRLLGKAYEKFKAAGYSSSALEREIELKERKQLEFASDNEEVSFLLVKIADIPQYIDKNWADIGVTAFDCYREYELSNITSKNGMRGDNFHSDMLPDLKLCENSRFCIAGRPELRAFYEKCKTSDEKIITIATQYPNIAAKYFATKGMIADIVAISGSSEIMPKYGEVDAIFDIVETGKALVENQLTIFDEAMPIQTRVLVSKAAFKYDENVQKMIEKLKGELK